MPLGLGGAAVAATNAVPLPPPATQPHAAAAAAEDTLRVDIGADREETAVPLSSHVPSSSGTQASLPQNAKPRARRKNKLVGAAAQDHFCETSIVPISLPRGPFEDIAAHREAIKTWAKSSNLNGEGMFHVWARSTDGDKKRFNMLWCTCGGDRRWTCHSGERNTPSVKGVHCKWHVTIRMGPANQDDPEDVHRCVPRPSWVCMGLHGFAWVCMGWHWHGLARLGAAGHGLARLGKAWHGLARVGTAWHGLARVGKAWQGLARVGKAWHGLARLGKAWQGVGTAWQGVGKAWHGLARVGKG